MPALKEIEAPADTNRYRRKLERLYARRTALVSLIQSLEDYQRMRAKRAKLNKHSA